MKTVGIIGGIGPESTIEYYKLIVSACLVCNRDGNYPQIIINSINMKQMLDLIGGNRLDEVTGFLADEIEKVARAGADFALLASNTPHIVFDRLQEKSSLPLVSIVAAACEQAKSLGFKRVGLFGTKFTMQSGFYNDVFSAQAISVVTPSEDEQDYIHTKYMDELVRGIIRSETRSQLIDIAQKLKARHKVDALILGGTELPLILKETDDVGMPLLDTTRIHVEQVVGRMLDQ